MGRAPCCDKANVKKGPWSPEEDSKLKEYIEKHGTGGNWIALPQKAGLRRCGKSCRLRWLNYLRPNIKHGEFTEDEDRMICSLYATIGSRWSIIAAQLPGRTDNDIKNYWNTKLKKKLMGFVPISHKKPPLFPISSSQETQLPLTSSSSLSSQYKDCNSCYFPTKSFLGLESLSFASNLLNNSNSLGLNPSFLHTQESLLCPVQYNYQARDTSIPGFAIGSEGSCSSSDGGSNQISNYGTRDIKQENCQISFQGHNNMLNGYTQENQKFVLGYLSNGGENVSSPYGYLEQIPLEYDLENVKSQIISSDNGNGAYESTSSLNIFNNVEESKTTTTATTPEKIMYMMYNYY